MALVQPGTFLLAPVFFFACYFLLLFYMLYNDAYLERKQHDWQVCKRMELREKCHIKNRLGKQTNLSFSSRRISKMSSCTFIVCYLYHYVHNVLQQSIFEGQKVIRSRCGHVHRSCEEYLNQMHPFSGMCTSCRRHPCRACV